MDLNDVRNIEFLDLSDVDEKEQIRVRNSLQHNDPSVQLPWIKPQKKTSNQDKNRHKEPPAIQTDLHLPPPAAPHTDYLPHPMVSPPLVNNIYTNPGATHVVIPPSMMQQYMLQSNVVCYTSSPMQATYPQQIFISPNAVHSFSHTAAYYPVAPAQAPEGDAGSPAQPEVPHQNGTVRSPTPQETGSEINPPVPENPPAKKEEDTTEEVIKEVVNVTPVIQPQTSPLVVQNGLRPPKSWASLFNSNKVSNGPDETGAADPKVAAEQVGKANNGSLICPIKNPRKSAQFIDPDCYRMGEFLSTYIVDGKAVSLQPRGLLNQSNYCYINSILQALIACPPMYNLVSGLVQIVSSNEKRKPTPVIDGICRFVKEFKHLPANLRVNNRRSDGKNQKKDQGIMINTDIPFEPAWIYKMLNGIQTDLIEGRQEDAEEFLGCLLNGLNDEMLELIKLVKNDSDEPQDELNDHGMDSDKEWKQVIGPKNKGSYTRRTEFGKTPISDIFGGFLKSRVLRAGDHITENIQPFFTLQLNIEKVKTVREALEALVMKNQLEGLTSSKTNEQVEAWQQVMLDELPVVLILHLKCFDYKLDGCTKIIKALEFPIDLKIEAKLLSSNKTQSQKEKQYKLFAVVYHDGKEATKGHYVTDAFHIGYSSWLRYDDASVKTVQEEQVLRPQGTRVPYLLFYRRCDTIKGK